MKNEVAKFRGFQSEWEYGGYAYSEQSDTHSIINDSGSFLVKAESVGQYTGLKDRYGNEIYAGDIVRAANDEQCEIVYGEYPFETDSETYKSIGFHFKAINKAYTGRKKNYAYEPFASSVNGDGTDYLIIGNIHDNPELLTQPQLS